MVGVLRVGSASRYTFDDVTLAYVQAATIEQLEQHRPFTLEVLHQAAESPTIVRVTAETALAFVYDTDTLVELDHDVLHWMSLEIELTGALRCNASPA